MGRPRTPKLDRDKIGAAALNLVDRDGDFTMPGLAAQLGVQVAAIYHHIPGGRAEVIELIRVRATGQVDGTAFDRLPWDEAFPLWARSFLDAFRAHSTAIRLLATEPVRDPGIVAIYGSVAGGLRRAGFPDDQIFGIVTAAESFFLGAALDSVAPDVMVTPGGDTPADLEAVLEAAPTGAERHWQAFEIGVRVFVDGLRSLLDATLALQHGHP